MKKPAIEWAPPTPQKWVPHNYQKKAVRFLLEHAAAGLLLDPGLGKTSITLAAIKVLKREKMLDRALIVAPLRPAQLVWPAEQRDWQDFNELDMVVLHGDHKEDLLYEDHTIYVINPEGLPWLMQDGRFKALDADTLVIDELSKFKHTNTQRFKTVKPVLGTFARRWGLTGSPNSNGYLDLFGQAYMLDMGRSLGKYITYYRTTYFFPTGYGGYTWVLKKGADVEIQQRLKPLMLRMDAEDYLSLPPLTDNPIYVDLPPKARKIYDQLEDEMFAQLDAETKVTSINAAAASIKCRQVANGRLYYEDWDSKLQQFARENAKLHDVKLGAVEELLEELQGSPLLLAYHFNHDLEALQEKFGKDLPYIGGGVSTKRAIQLERMWNAGEIPLLAGQPQSIGHGLNMQKASNNIGWYGLTWDYELYDQFIRRVRRQGNKSSRIFNHLIMARNTMEAGMWQALKDKKHTQQSFLDALNTYRRSRKRVA